MFSLSLTRARARSTQDRYAPLGWRERGGEGGESTVRKGRLIKDSVVLHRRIRTVRTMRTTFEGYEELAATATRTRSKRLCEILIRSALFPAVVTWKKKWTKLEAAFVYVYIDSTGRGEKGERARKRVVGALEHARARVREWEGGGKREREKYLYVRRVYSAPPRT